jgi:general secretion pathway protein N
VSRLVFFVLLAVGVVIGAAVFAPLSVVLDAAGARRGGLEWTSARGTLLDGRLEGITHDGKTIGDAGVRLLPAALLRGTLRFAVDWSGPSGRGAGQLSLVSSRHMTLRDYDLDLDLLELEQAARWIQQSGGRVRLEGDLIRFRDNACVEAIGVARSDVLERNRAILGDGWSPMQGDLRCEAGDLVIPFESANATGTKFGALLRVRPGLPGRFEARVSGRVTRDLDYMLPLAGFRRDGNEYTYSFSASAAGRNPI